MQSWKTNLTRRLLAAVVAVVSIASLAGYELAHAAKAAVVAPAAAPLDDNSVAAILTLDRAMETLAARVTPAVVNVTVTSKEKAQEGDDQSSDEIQRFFAPFGGSRQFRMPRSQRDRVEHGLGSGVIISPDGADQQPRGRWSHRHPRHHDEPRSAVGKTHRH